MSATTGIGWTDRTGRHLGAIKRLAAQCGLSSEEYAGRRAAGWKRCTDCKSWLFTEGSFAKDASRDDGLAARCRGCASARGKRAYVPVPAGERVRPGPRRIAARDGDKLQARRRINHDVRLGLRHDPDSLHCVYCGHKGDDRRHEYHHHMGYAAAHHNDVLPACTTCHHAEDAKEADHVDL